MMLLVALAMIYISSGMLAYGLSKGDWQSTLEYCHKQNELQEEDFYSLFDESIALLFGLMGPIGLIIAFLSHFAFRTPDRNNDFRFCYKMPKNFCGKPKNEEGAK